MASAQSQLKWGGVRVAFGGFVMHLALGTMYTFGNATSYLTSHLRKYDPSITYQHMLLVFALQIVGQATTMFLGGMLETKVGPRIASLIGGLTMASAVALSSLVKSYIAFAALYGLMFGVGIGLAYSAPLVCGARWVPQRKGLINGVVTAGFGLGAFAFNFVITALVNPHNNSPCVYNNATCPWGVEGSKKTYFDPQGDVASRVPHLLLILAAAYAALVIVGASMLTNPAAALQRKRDRYIESFVDPSAHDAHKPLLINTARLQARTVGMTPRQVVTSGQGWLLWLMMIVTTSTGIYVIGSYKTYAETLAFGTNDDALSHIGSGMSVTNFCGRVVQGFLADIFGAVPVIRGMAVLSALLTATLTQAKSEAMFTAWVLLITFCYGGNFSLFPTATMHLFGHDHAGENYGIIITALGVSGLVGTLLKSELLTAFHKYEYLNYFMAGLSVFWFVLSLGLRRSRQGEVAAKLKDLT